ncbi:MAG: hypothetical protein V4615_03940 [Bacteroidota bacterium]
MSETTSTTPDVLPLIRNASIIRLKLIALQPGETLEVIPKDLPPSYKGIKRLVSSIQNNYPLFYVVQQLTSGGGWRVVRVNSAEEADSFTPKRKKKKTSRASEPVRLYNMGDADLCQLIDEKILLARRDIADLNARGVTVAVLDELQLDNEAFKNMDVDGQLHGAEQEAVERKDAARNVLENHLGNLRTMAENTFGSSTIEYEVFGFEGMVGETDDKLLRLAKTARKQGLEDQAAMAVWGCSVAFLAQLHTDIETFDTEIGNAKTAEGARKKATVLRVKTANNLYIRLDKICNTGKDVYRSTNAVKRSDYLIYS